MPRVMHVDDRARVRINAAPKTDPVIATQDFTGRVGLNNDLRHAAGPILETTGP